MDANPFSHPVYLVKKQFFKLFGGAFRIYNPSNELSLFVSMQAFKLREDIRFYSDESMAEEILLIKARHIIDWSAAYDVYDPKENMRIGTLKRKGWKSLIQDEWVIMDAMENEIGMIQEDSLILGLVRRFLTNLIPQKYHGTVNGIPAFYFTQHFNPFWLKLDLDFTPDMTGLLDRRIGLAAAVLLCAIEGRQEN